MFMLFFNKQSAVVEITLSNAFVLAIAQIFHTKMKAELS